MKLLLNNRFGIVAAVMCMSVVLVSCGSSRKTGGYGDVKATKSMRDIERHSPRENYDNQGMYVSSAMKKANAEKNRKEAARKKADDKTYKKAKKEHYKLQSKDMQERMKTHLAESNERYSNKRECFVKRWWNAIFKPSTDIEKIEKRRAKEVERRMAATRKKADRNNKRRMSSSYKNAGKKREAHSSPDGSVGSQGGGFNQSGTSKGDSEYVKQRANRKSNKRKSQRGD